jgi:hypothetical protein
MGARILSTSVARVELDVSVAIGWLGFSRCEAICAGVVVGESRLFERLEVAGLAKTSSSSLGFRADHVDAALA